MTPLSSLRQSICPSICYIYQSAKNSITQKLLRFFPFRLTLLDLQHINFWLCPTTYGYIHKWWQYCWLCFNRHLREIKQVWLGNTTITHCRPTHDTVSKSNRTIKVSRHQECKQSEVTSSPLSLDCNIRKGTKKHTTKHGTNTEVQQSTTNQQQNHRISTASSLSHMGALMHFTGTNISP